MNDDTRPERTALVCLPYRTLATLLQLPLGARIDMVQSDLADHEMALVRVRDAGWLTCPGDRIPVATATVTEYRDDDGRCFKRVVEWNFSGPRP